MFGGRFEDREKERVGDLYSISKFRDIIEGKGSRDVQGVCFDFVQLCRRNSGTLK